MRKTKDIIGQVFGRLTVVSRAPRKGAHRVARWHCLCVCGAPSIVSGANLKKGHTKSCGCLQREVAKINIIKCQAANITDGRSFTAEYGIWANMKQRCLNKNDASYKDYGGRGITVCARWLSFDNFLADMGRRPSPGLSIDRVDNDGGYEPGNCRWATQSQQVRNQRVRRCNNTGVTGVLFYPYLGSCDPAWYPGTYQVNITVGGSNRYLGSFHSLFDAVAARKSAEVRFW